LAALISADDLPVTES